MEQDRIEQIGVDASVATRATAYGYLMMQPSPFGAVVICLSTFRSRRRQTYQTIQKIEREQEYVQEAKYIAAGRRAQNKSAGASKCICDIQIPDSIIRLPSRKVVVIFFLKSLRI